MAIAHNDLNGGLRHVILSGRLDFHGVEAVIEPFSALLASAKADVLVDLENATVICSMGIRALILNAKYMQQRGGRMALLVGDGTMVSATLKSVGIDTLLPVYTSLAEAQASMAPGSAAK
jgi:anti-sigma B factor antagonist